MPTHEAGGEEVDSNAGERQELWSESRDGVRDNYWFTVQCETCAGVGAVIEGSEWVPNGRIPVAAAMGPAKCMRSMSLSAIQAARQPGDLQQLQRARISQRRRVLQQDLPA